MLIAKLKKYSEKAAWFKPIHKKMSYLGNRMKYSFYRHTVLVDDKTIIFESFWGKSVNCSPKAIYEEMLRDPRYQEFNFIWAVANMEEHAYLKENERTMLVKMRSKSYYKAFAKAKYWVYNMSIPDFMFTKKNQVYIETWHGTPLKRIGCDTVYDIDYRRSLKDTVNTFSKKGKKFTYLLSTSKFYTDVITSAFNLKENNKTNVIIETGYPRNDFLLNYTPDDVIKIKEKLEITADKKLLLYAPTWRDNQYTAGRGFTYQNAMDFKKLLEILGDDYIILYRAHHHVKECVGVEYTSQIIDVGEVEDINDLYVISDMLITDYSSTTFDYANLKRPMLFFMYDLEEYGGKIRGFYFDVNELPGPIVKTTQELGEQILYLSEHFTYDEKYQAFHDKFNPLDDGFASRRVLEKCIPPEGDGTFTFIEWLKQHPIFHKIVSIGVVPLLFIGKRTSTLIRLLKRIKNKCKFPLLKLKYNLLALIRKAGAKRNKNYNKLLKYKNKHVGERCFLIGNGPSLKADDLELLKGEICFGCNMIHKIYDKTSWRPKYLCAIDKELIYHLYEEFDRNFPYPLFVNKASYDKMTKFPKNISYVQNVSANDYKIRGNMLAYYIPSKATVMSFMLELAMFMGFKEIYLVGVDCTSTFTGKGHFIQNYMNKVDIDKEYEKIRCRLKLETITAEDISQYYYKVSVSAYSTIEEYAKKKGIKIYNATRGGALEKFERRSIEDVLKLNGQINRDIIW